jgi:cell division septation protein DedD
LAGLVLAVAVIFIYSELSERAGDGEAPPVVAAEEGPDKLRPEDPGGMEVPDQDKLVYDRITGEEAAEDLEQLLPPPEEPLLGALPSAKDVIEPSRDALDAARAAAREAIKDKVAGVDEADRSAIAETETPTEGAEPDALAAAADGDTANGEPSLPAIVVEAATMEAVEPSASEIESMAEIAPAAGTPAGSYMIQIGAFRSVGNAEDAGNKARTVHDDLLGALGVNIQRADLGQEKGVFFRARLGPVERADAKALCSELKSRKVDCLVVKG